MKRRKFLKAAGITGGLVVTGAAAGALVPEGMTGNNPRYPEGKGYGSQAWIGGTPEERETPRKESRRAGRNRNLQQSRELAADLVIAGGGLGGVACALAALESGLTVVMTEETKWIGGQLTSQGVPPDEHRWIESHGATKSYRKFRERLREYYKRNYPLTGQARALEHLNPGNGAVSRICVEPTAGVAVLKELLAPWQSVGKLILLTETRVITADADGETVRFLEAECRPTGRRYVLKAPWFVDATELGDLLPLTGTAYVKGAESKRETGELHAREKGDPENQQAFTLCFAMEYQKGRDFTIARPEQYDFWRSYVPRLTPPWPGKLLDLTYSQPSTLKPKTLGFQPEGVATGSTLNLWNYRKIIDRNNFAEGFYAGDITLVNWPQNDYLLGNLIDATEEEFCKALEGARQLNLSLLYWLQTEVERPDGGRGWPGLRLRPDVMGSEDGMALYPYIRESRRIKALFTVKEEHVGVENRKLVKGEAAVAKAEEFHDSVGVGFYYLDLHPSTGGDNYIDMPSLPFQIPLGALIPQQMKNLLPANKNIGTTHITNGCYRLHPVEWNIGESAGLLVAYALQKKIIPAAIRETPAHLEAFQQHIRSRGIETRWPA